MKLQHFFICSAIALLLTASGGDLQSEGAVYAAETIAQSTSISEITRAEQTEWRYRTVDGKSQKRLWSITDSRWLGDWQWA